MKLLVLERAFSRNRSKTLTFPSKSRRIFLFIGKTEALCGVEYVPDLLLLLLFVFSPKLDYSCIVLKEQFKSNERMVGGMSDTMWYLRDETSQDKNILENEMQNVWEDRCSALFRVISFPPIFTLSFSICLMLVFNFWFALLLRQKNFLYKSERDCCEELLIETETNRMFQDWFRIPSEKLLLQLLLVCACCEV